MPAPKSKQTTTLKAQDLLIPVRRLKPLDGRFCLKDGMRLSSPRSVDALPLEQLRKKLAAHGCKRLRVVLDASRSGHVNLLRSPLIQHEEGYRLTITSEGIDILARTDAGAYYAIQTLMDLVTLCGNELPGMRIDDEPDFRRRAIYHDCARGKVPTLETLKSLIVRLAHWKVNELQLYIENAFAFRKHPAIGKGFSPFRAADILELQDFCKQHHVRLVGSMASFGHMELVLQTPGYQHLGELPGWNDNPGGTTLCPTDPGSIRLVKDLYDEFLPLFESEDFNACGDEPWELGKGRSSRQAKARGQGRVYIDFMLKIHKLCQSHGKRTNLWAEVVMQHPELLPAWPKEIVMLNWAYDATSERIRKTHLFAEAGLPFMVCSGTHGWGSHGSRMDKAFANVEAFSRQARRYGAEGILHTDWGDNGHRNTLAVSLCSMAHGAAHSWNGNRVDSERFPETFCRLTYGQTDPRLADNLRTLGNIDKVVDRSFELYYSLRFGLLKTQRRKLLRVDYNDPRKIAFPELPTVQLQEALTRLEPLRDPGAWPQLPSTADRFDRLMLDSYRLAVEQDAVACQRIIMANRLRAGESITAAEWKHMESLLAEMGAWFDRLWTSLNRPSRLHENQALITAACQECRSRR